VQKSPMLAVALLVISTAGVSADTITVTPAVTPDGPNFDYDYSISNATGLDLPVLDIVVAPGTLISGLAAPSGFQSAYDPVLGLVSFLEDSDVFGPSAISGFDFSSPLRPTATMFNATLLDANFNVILMSSPTIGPAGSVVPEPGMSNFLMAGFCVLILLRWAVRPPSHF
jgi:hypothetical protein